MLNAVDRRLASDLHVLECLRHLHKQSILEYTMYVIRHTATVGNMEKHAHAHYFGRGYALFFSLIDDKSPHPYRIGMPVGNHAEARS